VSDVDRAYAFYHHIVGLNESYTQPLNKAAFLGNNNTHHDVAVIDIHGPIGRGNSVGLNHLAFELENEVDLVAGYEHAKAAGIEFARTLDHDIAHSVYMRDPDGNMTEMYADVIKDWRGARLGVVTKPKPKWAPGMTKPSQDSNYHVDPDLTRVQGAVFNPRRIVHATLVVGDMNKALEYYTNVVGLRPMLKTPREQFVVLGGTCGEESLNLFPAGNGHNPGFHHAGFQMWSEGELIASLAKAKDCGAQIEVDISYRTRRSVFILDPDGFRLQFFVDHDSSPFVVNEVDRDLALYLH
jgi:catechol 2,3-dioxygenase